MKSLMGIIKGTVLGVAMAGLGACAPAVTSVHYNNYMRLHKEDRHMEMWYTFGLITGGKTPNTADRKEPFLNASNGTSYCLLEISKDNEFIAIYDVGCDGSPDYYEERIERIGEKNTPYYISEHRGNNSGFFEGVIDPFFREKTNKILHEGKYMETKYYL